MQNAVIEQRREKYVCRRATAVQINNKEFFRQLEASMQQENEEQA